MPNNDFWIRYCDDKEMLLKAADILKLINDRYNSPLKSMWIELHVSIDGIGEDSYSLNITLFKNCLSGLQCSKAFSLSVAFEWIDLYGNDYLFCVFDSAICEGVWAMTQKMIESKE